MNQMNANSFVGTAVGGMSAGTPMEPLKIKLSDIRAAAKDGASANVLSELSLDQIQLLTTHLESRLAAGMTARDRRVYRYSRIDRTISTWQKLNSEDSERERIEDATGKQTAIPMNLPILASHLNDMASYFTEVLAPVSNPFFSAKPEGQTVALLEKMNRDAAARDYFGQLNLTIRSLLKYNIGGFEVVYEAADPGSNNYSSRQPGNCYYSCDMYNTFWDPAIKNPKDIPYKAEWAATVCIENRLELMRNTLSGDWVGLEQMLAEGTNAASGKMRYYKSAAYEATYGDEGGADQRTTQGTGVVQWASYGLGLTSDLGPEIDGFEKVSMYCWLVPAQFGLLTDAERKLLDGAGIYAESYIELWKFEIVAGKVVSAKPHLDRSYSLNDEVNEIPLYLAYMTADQLKEAQRSFMELMRGFQRFGSAMFNIYIAGMRRNVWGVIGIDPTMFDASKLKSGDSVGVLESKIQGRDVRSGLATLSNPSGVEGALNAVDSTLAIKDKFFPAQALPSQVAGIDRAVKSQVTTVIQGAQRSMRTLVRSLDSMLMLPTRLCAFRNLKRNDIVGIEQMTDEDVAKMVGSGIESMESERVLEYLWQLIYAIIQNVEAMQTFNVPDLFAYAGRVANLSVDLGQFVRPAPQPASGQGGTPESPPAPGAQGAAPQA